MLPTEILTQVSDQPPFNVPKKRKRGTVEMCMPCRESKRKCSYSENNTWPEPCLSCAEKKRECSAPRLKDRSKRLATPHSKQYDDSSRAWMSFSQSVLGLPNFARTAPLSTAFEDIADVSCKRAVIFLSLDEVLSTCIEELVDLTTDMMRPFQRHSQREDREDNIPEVSAVINELNQLSQLVNIEMEDAARAARGTTLFLAENALRTHHFRRNHSWGVDFTAVGQCLHTIAQFLALGHTSLAYVLQVRLLRESVHLSVSQLEIMTICRSHFVADVDKFFRTIPTKYSGRQMFIPKELVRIPAFEAAITADGRPDYLGRAVAHIKFEAGLPVEWSAFNVLNKDVLCRTGLHQAVHRRYNSVVKQLLILGADPTECCLNKLSPLHIAACQVDAPDSAGRTAFWYAARGSQFGVMGVLCHRHDVNIDHRDNYGLSPAVVAARDGRYGVLGYLLRKKSDRMKAGISPEAERFADNDPLLLASEAGQTKCVDLLLKPNFRTWEMGDPEYQALIRAAEQRGDQKLVEEFRNLRISEVKTHFADIGDFLLDPKAAKKSVSTVHPYILDPRGQVLAQKT